MKNNNIKNILIIQDTKKLAIPNVKNSRVPGIIYDYQRTTIYSDFSASGQKSLNDRGTIVMRISTEGSEILRLHNSPG